MKVLDSLVLFKAHHDAVDLMFEIGRLRLYVSVSEA